MEPKKCSTQIEECYQKLQKIKYKDITQWEAIAKELLSLAQAEKRARMTAVALQALAEHSFYLSNFEECENFCTELIALCDIVGYRSHLAQAFNLMGGICTKNSNEVKALDYFYLAIDSLRGTEYYLLRSSIYTNIGQLYTLLKDYEEALVSLEQAQKNLYEELKLRERNFEYLIYQVHYLTKCCLCYCAMGDIIKGIQTRKLLMELEGIEEVPFLNQTLSILQAKLGYQLGEFEQMKLEMDIIITNARKLQLFVMLYPNYLDLLDNLVSLDDYDRVERMVEVLEPTVLVSKSIPLMLRYYQIMISYYRKTKKEGINVLYYEFYELMKQRELKVRESRISNIKTRISLEHEMLKQQRNEREVKRLKSKSEHDVLTGLANRYLLNEYCEQLFEENRRVKSEFGIIVIDIDYFKIYNDFYGHLEGDVCIKGIAEVIQRFSHGQFCSRFGGDEFFVITSGLAEEVLYQMSEEIREGVLSLKLRQPEEVAMRYVTVSQGICSAIPIKDQTYSDFIHAADMALYRGKKAERNAIFLGNLK